MIGAQIISNNSGIKERVDALSIAMSCNLTANQLAHIETAYTPPVASLVDIMTDTAYKVWIGKF